MENNLTLQTTSLNIIERKQPILVSKMASGLSIENIFQIKGTQLSELENNFGREYPKIALHYIVLEFSKLVPNTFAMPDMEILVESFLTRLWHLKIEDIILCLKRGSDGYYGKIFGNVYYSTIMEWFQKYEDERFKIIEYQQQSHKEQPGARTKDRQEEQAKNIIAKAMEKNFKTPKQ